jgi:uncharacterized repeat protein (TIGR02543 family)
MSNVTIQPSGIDAYLNQGAPTTNNGAGSTILVRSYASNQNRSILKFDFSAVVPAGATITLATLSLYTTTTLASRTITVYRLLRTDWVENEACWNYYKGTTVWGTAGALNTTTDITTTDAATATSVAANQWLNETVTAQVQTALDSVAGVAHFLVADVSASNGDQNVYSSREAGTTANRPKLYIEYTVPSTVTFNSQGGTPTPSPITNVAYGATVTLPTAPTRAGYIFGGWWTGTGGTGTQFTASTPVNANITVYAQWTAAVYTLTYTAGANGSISGASPQTVDAGASGAQVTAVPNANYHFVNWSDASTANPRTDTGVAADITVTANFAIDTFTVTFDKNGGVTEASPASILTNYNTTVTLPTPPTKTGYTFVGWNTVAGGGGTTFNASTPVTANVTVYAQWIIAQYTLTYTAGANGTIMGPSPQTVNYLASGVSVTAIPSINCLFVNWSDGVTTATRTDINVSGNITVTANFAHPYSVCIPLERGSHSVYVQATDSIGTVVTAPIAYVTAYELATYGIDVYLGDAKLNAIEPVLYDELLPALPTLNFSCAELLTGTIQAVIRERGIRKYQFTIDTTSKSGAFYAYTCKAAESYDLTSEIMALQTSYGSTSDAIKLLVPSLNIVDGNGILAQITYPQMFARITPVEVIKQLLIQSLAQASVRNGNLYVFPMDVSAQVPDYHMQRLDPRTGWQRDDNVYGAVQAHYVVKQYPTPSTVLTLNDAINWTGVVVNLEHVVETLLPAPSGAANMLWFNGNASRAGLSAFFKDFDRIRFNWHPDTATALTVSLQQDASNKLEFTHYFNGPVGAGFVLTGTPGVSTDTLTKNITLSPVQFVKTVSGTVSAGCSYRVTLLNAAGTTLWQDIQRGTIGNTFEADVPTSVSQVSQTTTVRIEFTNLYLIGTDYGARVIECDIQVQTLQQTGSHYSVASSVQYPVVWGQGSYTSANGGSYVYTKFVNVPAPGSGERYQNPGILSSLPTGYYGTFSSSCEYGSSPSGFNCIMVAFGNVARSNSVLIAVLEHLVTDYAWISSYFMWSYSFNLFEAVDIPLNTMARTGNPVTLQTIVLTATEYNYVDTLVLVADNPLPATVEAGTGSRAYVVTDDFGSQAGAQAYADGLLPVVSVAREQYTRDVSLATDLGVGDTINGDGTNMTVYAIDYRADGKTVAAGKAMDTLMTRLAEQARRLGTLERKGA